LAQGLLLPKTHAPHPCGAEGGDFPLVLYPPLVAPYNIGARFTRVGFYLERRKI